MGRWSTLQGMLLVSPILFVEHVIARDINGPNASLAKINFEDMARTWPRLAARVLASGLTRYKPGSPVVRHMGCVMLFLLCCICCVMLLPSRI